MNIHGINDVVMSKNVSTSITLFILNTTMKTSTIPALCAMMLLAGASAVNAQESSSPKFSITPTGRVLFDGAVYAPDNDGFTDGVAMPDIRMGVKAAYGNWSAKIDVGYAFKKLGFKDVYIQYTFNNEHLLRLGYFVHQFGLNASTSSSMKPAMEAPGSDNFFAATGRNMGLMYVLDKPSVFLGVSAFAAGNCMDNNANALGKVSVGALNRLVYRPWHDTGLIGQLGISLWYQSAMHTKVTDEDGTSHAGPGYFDYSATFPTRVCSTPMLNANVQNAKGVFKLSPELVFATGRVGIEGQYYYMRIGRNDGLATYTAQGGYALLRGILIGKNYSYSHADAGLATPAPKSLEMVLGYNRVDGTCTKADILGGISNDYSVTLNYYINKYMVARLRYSYTDVSQSAVQRNRHVNIIQARLQFKF